MNVWRHPFESLNKFPNLIFNAKRYKKQNKTKCLLFIIYILRSILLVVESAEVFQAHRKNRYDNI